MINYLDLVLPFAWSAGNYWLGQRLSFFFDDLDQVPGEYLHRAIPGCALSFWERDVSNLDPVFTMFGFGPS